MKNNDKAINVPQDTIKISLKRRLFPYVPVHDVNKYFELPKEQREQYGIYLKPHALPSELFFNDRRPGWTTFSKRIREEYPIQGWFREWFLSYDNPLYSYYRVSLMRLNDLRYKVKRFINPMVPRMRKAWKRHEYMDISDGFVAINFGLILDFWYEEVKDSWVNWQSDEAHEEFYDWLEQAVIWIETEKPQALNEIDEKQRNINVKGNREEILAKYKIIEDLDQKIADKDTEILVEAIKRRSFFWT